MKTSDRPDTSGRDRTELLWIGVLIGVFGGYFAFVKMHEIIEAKFESFIVPMLILLAAMILLLFLIFLFRRQLIEGVFGVSRASLASIMTSVVDVVQATHANSREEAYDAARLVAARVGASFSYWMLRTFIVRAILSLILVFAGALTIVLMSQQNEELRGQNANVETQNALMNLQLKNLEMNRRRLFDDDLKAARAALQAVAGGAQRSENLNLLVQVAANAFTPYFYYSPLGEQAGPTKPVNDMEELTGNMRYLSPERGLLLQAMVMAKIDMIDSDDGAREWGDFRYADARGMTFSPYWTGKELAEEVATENPENADNEFDAECQLNVGGRVVIANVEKSDFSRAYLTGVNMALDDAIFTEAEFWSSDLHLGPEQQHLPLDATYAGTRIALSLEQFLKSLPVLKEGGVRAACLVIYLPDEQREDLREKMPNGSLAELKHALKVDGFPESNWVATWRGDEIVLRHVPS